MLLGMVFRLRLVDEIGTVFLNFPIDEGTGKASKEFFGLGMCGRLAVLGYMVLICLGSRKGRSTTQELMAEVSLVFGFLLVLTVSLSVCVVVAVSHDDDLGKA